MDNASLTTIRKFVVEDIIPHSFKILKKYFKSKRLEIKAKSFIDIVTEADLDNERFLRKKILQKYPNHLFLGEESSKSYFDFRDKKNLWIIDPLDGTVNFSRGQDNFAVSIALVDQGKTKLGVIGIPMKNQIFWGQIGVEGVCNNQGLETKISDITQLNKASLRCDWVYNPITRKKLAKFLVKSAPKVRQILTGGSAVADMIDVILGKVDIYFNPGLKPWDVAGSCFLIEKAGGKVTTILGKNWNVFEQNLVITNGRLHKEFLEVLAGGAFR